MMVNSLYIYVQLSDCHRFTINWFEQQLTFIQRNQIIYRQLKYNGDSVTTIRIVGV